MKSFPLLLLALFIAGNIAAQPPGLFKYQGIARDSTGNPVSNDTISLRISIHQGSLAGTVIYQETHSLVFTNQFGSFSINIGGGTVNTGNFSTIPWSSYNYFQEVEMDVTGGSSFVSMGTSQYLSVPYALAADSALHGVAPFVVQNLSGGNTVAAVAIAAIANTAPNTAPALYVKNNSLGASLYAESGNGIFVLADSAGVETNGKSHLRGDVEIDQKLTVYGPIVANSLEAPNTYIGTITPPQVLNVNGETVINNKFTVFGQEVVNGNVIVNGNLGVNGNLSKASGSFKIDHPLDPMNKFLYHSFVESPDMKNIYDGTVVTDAEGNATIELPAYFEALNSDFRYQLTAIGQFAQAIVSKEISNNSFHIKTDRPNVKISWQVTGIRKDAFAEKHRIVPEVEKDKNEKGKYLYPDSYEQVKKN